jgi:hypothetical protein
MSYIRIDLVVNLEGRFGWKKKQTREKSDER